MNDVFTAEIDGRLFVEASELQFLIAEYKDKLAKLEEEEVRCHKKSRIKLFALLNEGWNSLIKKFMRKKPKSLR